MEIQFKGLTLQIGKTNHTPERPAPIAQTPDCPGYADPGDDEEIEFVVTGAEVDCLKTLIEALGLESDEELGGLVIAAMSDE